MSRGFASLISARLVLAAVLVLALLLISDSRAQDSVTMIAIDSGQPLVHRGSITFVDLADGTLRLRTGEGATISLALEGISSIQTDNPVHERKWETVLKERQGETSVKETPGGVVITGTDGGARGPSRDPTPEEAIRIDTLIKYLGAEPSAEDQLVELGGLATMQVLVKLGHFNDAFREATCRVLGRIGDPRAIDGLIQRIEDNYDGVRRAAVIALGQIAPDDANVQKSLMARAKVENVARVMKEIVLVLGPAGAKNAAIKKQVLDDSYSASKDMVLYYYACLSMMGDRESGDKLKVRLDQGVQDDVFISIALAPTDRAAAIGHLIKRLKASKGEVLQEDEITDALSQITGNKFGNEEADDLQSRERAKQEWIEWYENALPAEEVTPTSEATRQE